MYCNCLDVFECSWGRGCRPPAQKNLTATPTSAPTPEISVDTEKQNPTDQGTLSKPDHPDTVSADKLIFIGDSRTEGLRDAVNDDSVWSVPFFHGV